MKKKSTYDLEERLACLYQIYHRLNDYSHVFSENEKFMKQIESMIEKHRAELERREEEEWEG
jgi:hypothetical protein